MALPPICRIPGGRLTCWTFRRRNKNRWPQSCRSSRVAISATSRHLRLEDRRRGQTACRKLLYPVHKGTSTDHAVNKEIVEFYGLAGQFRSGWLHLSDSFQENISRLWSRPVRSSER